MQNKKIAIEIAANEVVEIHLVRKEVNPQMTPVISPKPKKRFYPIEWVVEYTGIPKSSIYQMTSKSTIAHIKRGRKLFFEKEKIDKWLEGGRVKTTEEIRKESEDYLTKRGEKIRS